MIVVIICFVVILIINNAIMWTRINKKDMPTKDLEILVDYLKCKLRNNDIILDGHGDYIIQLKDEISTLKESLKRINDEPIVRKNGTTVSYFSAPCWFPDGTCMNPHRDCVNCPRPSSGGGYTTTDINTNKEFVQNIGE